MVLSSGEGSVSSLLVDRLYFIHTQEYLGSTLDLVCYLKKIVKKDTVLEGDGDVVDMGGVGDKYDQSTLYDILKELIKILYEN